MNKLVFFFNQFRFLKHFYLQKLKLWKFEKSGWQHCQSVSVQLQDQQGAGDVFKTARFKDTDLVIAQIPIRQNDQITTMYLDSECN